MHTSGSQARALFVITSLLACQRTMGEQVHPLSDPRPHFRQLWERRFPSIPDPEVVISGTGERVGFSPGTDTVYVFDQDGAIVRKFVPSGNVPPFKVWVRHMSHDGGRVVCEGLRLRRPNSQSYEGMAWLLEPGETAPLLRLPLSTNGEVGEQVVSLSARGDRLLIADPAVECSVRLLDDTGNALWRSDALVPPIRSGGRGGVLSLDGKRAYIHINGYSRWTCVTEQGQRVWDLVCSDDHGIRFSRDGRFLFTFGAQSLGVATGTVDRGEAGYQTWPIVPPSDAPRAVDPEVWRHVYAAPTWSEGTQCALFGVPPPGMSKYSAHSVGLLWGHIDVWLGSKVDSRYAAPYRPPRVGIRDAQLGAGGLSATVAVLREDGLYSYSWQPVKGTDHNASTMEVNLLHRDIASIRRFATCPDGSRVFATVQAPECELPEQILVWTRDGKHAGSIKVAAGVECSAVSVDGRRVAVLGHDGMLRLYGIAE